MKKIIHISFFALALLFSIHSAGLSQTDTLNSFYTIDSLFSQPVSENVITRLELLEARIKQHKSNTGLGFRAYFNNNFNELFSNSEEEYYSSLRTGVEWNILRNGVYSSKIEREMTGNELKLLEIGKEAENRKYHYKYLYNYLIYSANSGKITHLKKRKRLLTEYTFILDSLRKSHVITYDQLIPSLKKLQEVENNLKACRAYNKLFDNYFDSIQTISFDKLPLFRVDIDKLEALLLADSTTARVIDLQSQNIELKYKLEKQPDLKLHARMNYLFNDRDDRWFPSVGVNLHVPLSKTHNKSVAGIERKQIAERETFMEHNRFQEILNHYHELNEKWKDYEEIEYNIELISERIRQREILFTPVSPETLPHYLKYDELLASKAEMNDLKKDMYLILLQIHSKINRSLPSQYLDYNSNLLTEKNLTIYINTKNWKGADWGYIADYLKVNTVRYVLFSTDPGDGIIEQLNNRNISTQIGEKGPGDYLILNVNDFPSKVELFRNIANSTYKDIVINNLKALIYIDIKQLKN